MSLYLIDTNIFTLVSYLSFIALHECKLDSKHTNTSYYVAAVCF